METIINVDDVSFSYGTQTEQTLSHISLSVNKGDFIGIIGPSGAGKSTLAACLSGAVPHHYTGTFFGSVMVDGHDTCEVSLTDVSQIVGSVLQDMTRRWSLRSSRTRCSLASRTLAFPTTRSSSA